MDTEIGFTLKDVLLLVMSIIAIIITLYAGYIFVQDLDFKQKREMFLLESEYDRQYKFTPLSDHHILIEGNKMHIDSLKNYIFDYE